MCRTCQTSYLRLRNQYPSHTIDASAPIYPVAFRARFPENEVPFDYGLKVADHIEEFLYEVYGSRIPVLAYSNFAERPSFETDVWVSVLIEFPDRHTELVERMFEGLVRVMGGWEVLLPEGCCNAFWLEWHGDPMGMA